MRNTYEILSSKLDALRARIKRINKTARKLGVALVTLTVVRTFVEVDADATRKARTWNADAPDVMRERTEVVVEGETPVLAGGYTFVASIDPMGIVFGAPGAVDVPESLVERRGECDHCNLPRRRNATFVVAHKDGTLKLVGRNCLGEFLGAFGNDPHAIWKFLEDFASLARDGADEVGAFGRSGDAMYSPKAVLTATYKVIKAYGWLAAGAAYNNPGLGTPTADRVRTLLFTAGGDELNDLLKATEGIDADEVRIEAALDWARNATGESDYIRNIRKLASADGLGYKHIGFAASILPAHDRETERDLVRAREVANRPESTWVGEVGDRVTFENATLNSVRELDGNFGITYLHKFTDAAGNDLVWFASNDNLGDEGEVLTFKATVKRHGDYRGRKNTVINRAKVA
jgi:hypothetical protein